jgi:carboxyl-terminal processing protease
MRILATFAILLALGTGFIAGTGYAQHIQSQTGDSIVTQVTNTENGKSKAVDFSLFWQVCLFWQVWNMLHERYVDSEKLDAQKLVYGAISGMVDAAGDPYTVFMEPQISREFEEQVSGAFSGVGMEIGKRDEVLTVITPIKDSPAMRAGVKAGDIVSKVDGQDTSGWTVEEAVSHIRGKKGTVVQITILREGSATPLEFSLTRDTIRIPAIEWKMLDGKVAYLQIFSFNGNVEDEFNRAAAEILSADAERLIIDVRNNPGGLLDSAVSIAGWMLPSGSVVVQERFGTTTTEELKTSGNSRLARIPTVFLINGGSASASEILAGAIHDNREVRLVGEKTFGKGSVQQIESFYNGSSLKVTVAKWFTPKGVSISDTGISPTDEVVLDPESPDAEKWVAGEPGKDPQLDRALEIIRNLR